MSPAGFDPEPEQTMTIADLSPATAALFLSLAKDADNWSGCPLFQGGKAERGNLTDLKVKGLVKTSTDEGCTWVYFTGEGKRLAQDLGIFSDYSYGSEG